MITKDASESSDWQTRVLKGEWYLRYGPLIRYCVNYENFIIVYLGQIFIAKGTSVPLPQLLREYDNESSESQISKLCRLRHRVHNH